MSKETPSAGSQIENASSTDFNIALGVALKSLAVSEKFTAEISRLLQKKGVDQATIEQVLQHLTAKNLLNDRRCAMLAISRLTDGKPVGRNRMEEKLAARGAPLDLIHELLPEQDTPETIQQALKKKFPEGTTKQKAARFLYSRGFVEDAIDSALEQFISSSD